METYGSKIIDANIYVSNKELNPNDYETEQDFLTDVEHVNQILEYIKFLEQFPKDDILPEKHWSFNYKRTMNTDEIIDSVKNLTDAQVSAFYEMYETKEDIEFLKEVVDDIADLAIFESYSKGNDDFTYNSQINRKLVLILCYLKNKRPTEFN